MIMQILLSVSRLTLTFGLIASALSFVAQAQEFPSRTLQVIVPFTAGGPTDAMARVVGRELARLTNQPVIVENRPGAGGNVGSAQVARAEPDGYTMIVNGGLTHTLNPQIFAKTSGYALKDFKAVAAFAKSPMVLTVNPDLGVNDVQQLVALAKAKPELLAYASVGTQMTHIHYRGGGLTVTDVISGQVPLLWVSIPAAAQLLRAGKLKALAVPTLNRSAAFPDVPTVQETGVPDFEVDSWYAMFVPAHTPQPMIDRLNRALNTVAAEVPKWIKLAEDANIKAD